MSSRLWPFLLLVPTVALAQTTVTGPSVTLLVNGSDAGYANASQCNDSETVSYTLNTTAAPCDNFTAWITANTTCGNTPSGDDLTLGSLPKGSITNNATGSFNFTVNTLPRLDGGCGAVEIQYLLCGSFPYPVSNGITVSCNSSSNSYSSLVGSPSFRYDAVPPPPPTISDVEPLENALTVKCDTSSDTVTVDLEVRPEVGDGGSAADGGTGGFISVGGFVAGTTAKITGLTNEVTYDIRAKALDGAGNESDYSPLAQGTPETLNGFWDVYQSEGGQTAGCSQSGMTPLWLVAVLPALFMLRRRWR